MSRQMNPEDASVGISINSFVRLKAAKAPGGGLHRTTFLGHEIVELNYSCGGYSRYQVLKVTGA